MGAENVGEQQIESLGKGQEELTSLVTSEYDANHLSSCLQEACFFYRNTL